MHGPDYKLGPGFEKLRSIAPPPERDTKAGIYDWLVNFRHCISAVKAMPSTQDYGIGNGDY